MEQHIDKVMGFEEYADSMEEWISTRMVELYHEGGLDTFQLYETVIDFALRDGVVLSDADDFDYDEYFSEWYDAVEKF